VGSGGVEPPYVAYQATILPLNYEPMFLSSFSGKKYHPFHLVTPSPWPLLTSCSAFGLTAGATLFMHAYGSGLLAYSAVALVYCMGLWWRDVVREATFEGRHTRAVQRGLRLGFILFIASEVMFFVAFFWGFFHSSLSPAVELGCLWPPVGITPFDPWGVPLLNTYILLLSGATVTATHHYLVSGAGVGARSWLVFTLVLALFFTLVQLSEYRESSFSINDGIYGSTFFMATGFHGLHVLVGTCFLAVCYLRLLRHHFTRQHHLGFEAAAWYWHFVDVVWLFLFVSIYWWGGR
jgi:cytochrome c oxidase subunit 3